MAGEVQQEAAADAAPSPGGDAVGDAGGEDLLATDTETDTAAPDAAADDAAADEGPLLAEPGQRDDWYQPVKSPAWKQGARKRSYLSSAGSNLASSSDRNLFKGWSGQMSPLSNGVVGENLNKEEDLVHQTQHDIKMLIEQLENKNESKTQ